MSSGRHRKFLRIELTEPRRTMLERWGKHLWGYKIDLSHVAAAVLDMALEERMHRLEHAARAESTREVEPKEDL